MMKEMTTKTMTMLMITSMIMVVVVMTTTTSVLMMTLALKVTMAVMMTMVITMTMKINVANYRFEIITIPFFFSAGVGRTGAFICIDAMMEHIDASDELDVYSFFCRMREQRNYMVQREVRHCIKVVYLVYLRLMKYLLS